MARSTTTTAARKSRTVAPKMTAATRSTWKHYSTIALGCWIPMAAMGLSHFAGDAFVEGRYAHGVGFLGICLAMLGVSLTHLQKALMALTHDGKRSALLYAITLDASIVACELWKAATGTMPWVMVAYLVVVTGISMMLNCQAFLLHQKEATEAARAIKTPRKAKAAPVVA